MNGLRSSLLLAALIATLFANSASAKRQSSKGSKHRNQHQSQHTNQQSNQKTHKQHQKQHNKHHDKHPSDHQGNHPQHGQKQHAFKHHGHKKHHAYVHHRSHHSWVGSYPRHHRWWYDARPSHHGSAHVYQKVNYIAPSILAPVPESVPLESRWYLGLTGSVLPGQGLGIESLEKYSPAVLAGLQPGMVILRCNGIDITDEAAFGEAVATSAGVLQLELLSAEGGEPFTVTVTMKRLTRVSF